MARVLVTGSATGLGRLGAIELLDAGHEVVVHARNEQRAGEMTDLADRGAELVVGDLAVRAEVRGLADQVGALAPLDAVIHNAGLYVDADRRATPDGHARVLAVNVLAPYLLTSWIERPARLIYLSSGMHHDGDPSLDDIDWTDRRWNGVQAYRDSKLFVTALAAEVADRWSGTLANAVDPGWVPTRMGGSGATDDLTLGHQTQSWLAVSDDATARVSGGYWYHQRQQPPHDAVGDPAVRAALIDRLAELTGVELI
ncbi:MAG: SDR family NAD(P)-dependent oxidoreductase [Desertimonas sp.]